MRRKHIREVTGGILQIFTITSLMIVSLFFTEKYQEEQYYLLQTENIKEDRETIDKEIEEADVVELNIPSVKSSLVESVTESSTESSAEEVIEQVTEQKVEKTAEQVTNQESTQKPEEIVQEEKSYVTEPYLIECTAYIPTGNPCRDGTYPVEGDTLAGKYSWLGRHCNLYYCTDDGQIGDLIGTYTFHDTGFGHDPDGDGIGSIQTGERIDLFMESYDRAIKWGVRKVYIEFLD